MGPEAEVGTLWPQTQESWRPVEAGRGQKCILLGSLLTPSLQPLETDSGLQGWNGCVLI